MNTIYTYDSLNKNYENFVNKMNNGAIVSSVQKKQGILYAFAMDFIDIIIDSTENDNKIKELNEIDKDNLTAGIYLTYMNEKNQKNCLMK